jgi:hypothetical protein
LTVPTATALPLRVTLTSTGAIDRVDAIASCPVLSAKVVRCSERP